MTVQITFIGLGQIGTSMGLALGPHTETIRRVGNDRRIEAEREAQTLGAIDRAVHNLPAAVREARIAVLSVPLNQLRAALEVIAPELPEGAIVLDMSPVKAQAADWAKSLLPAGRFYVGLVPSLTAESLQSIQLQSAPARADLFQRAVFIVDSLPGTPEEVVSLACNFVQLLGAVPIFADMAESDGLIAATHILPQLAAASLLNAIVDRPGWMEARKLAGSSFAAIAAGLGNQDDLDSLRLAAMHNASNTLRTLDVLIAALQGMRAEIAAGDEDGLAERIEAAREGRERWLRERFVADWTERTGPPPDIPTMTERLLGTSFAKPRRNA